jgi:hypothetical protein
MVAQPPRAVVIDIAMGTIQQKHITIRAAPHDDPGTCGQIWSER